MKTKLIRCKREDDVVVIHPGAGAGRLAQAFMNNPASCGHKHLIVVGNPRFAPREEMAESLLAAGAADAYQNNPLAKVFVDTIADQYGLGLGGVTENLVVAVLGHKDLLAVLHEARHVQAERNAKPKTILPA